jgi:uncharacterized protein (TIGR02147 family)
MKRTNDYKEILQFEFDMRKRRNPRFSLRGFAKLLGFAPSGLSQIMSGKQGLSEASAKKIGETLGWNAKEIEFFSDLVTSSASRSVNARKLAKIRLKQHDWQENLIQDDVFQYISNWYHFAILELTMLENFNSQPQWIAKSLKISLKETKEAIKTLLRLKLLVSDENGNLTQTEGFLGTNTDIPSDALKAYHTDILKKGLEALFDQKVEDRDFSAIIMAINSEDIPEAKALIKDFRRSLMHKLEARPDRDSVYTLAIQLFKLTDQH